MKLALGAVAALVVFAAACNGGGDKSEEPGLGEAIERTKAAGSARFALEARVVGADAVNTCMGENDYARERLRAECEFGAFRYQMIAFGRTGFFRTAPDQTWELTSASENDSNDSLTRLEQLLDLLGSSGRDIERLGRDDVRGKSTVRYGLTVDCAPAGLSCSGGTTHVDVWIDGDGLVRRIELEEAGSAVVELFDFGLAVDVEPPPHDQVEDPVGHFFGPGPGGLDPCSGGGKPISVEMAVYALRRNGLTVSREEDTRCRTGVAAKITNEHEGYEVFGVEGLVHCSLLREAQEDAWSVVVREDGSVGGRGVELELENLHCAIVSSSVDDENVRGFERAFKELERKIRP